MAKREFNQCRRLIETIDGRKLGELCELMTVQDCDSIIGRIRSEGEFVCAIVFDQDCELVMAEKVINSMWDDGALLLWDLVT
jgi:hypothetical protein